MNWKLHTERLMNGETIQIRPTGNSMRPRIESGNLVTVAPITDYSSVQKGDIVLCKVNGRYYLHLVHAIKHATEFLIGNNKGHINGWTNKVYGKVTHVEE